MVTPLPLPPPAAATTTPIPIPIPLHSFFSPYAAGGHVNRNAAFSSVPHWNSFTRLRSSTSTFKAYRRIPLDTADAYRLVDDQTGESFILWGRQEEEEGEATNDNNIAFHFPQQHPPPPRPKSSSSSPIGSFCRLNAQKVRSLLRRKHHRGNVIDNEVDSARNNNTINQNSTDATQDSNFTRVIADQQSPFSVSANKPSKARGRDRGDSTNYDKINNRNTADDTQHSNFVSAIADQPSFSAVSANKPSKERGRGWGDSTDYDDGYNKYNDRKQQYQKNKPRFASSECGFFSKRSFKQLGCNDGMINALRDLHFLRPSNIQAMAYAPVLEGKTCVVADQSGSGKTLAYLAPTIQCLRQEELLGLGKPLLKNPRVLILVPTAELASQVLNNCRSISKHGVPFRSMVATGGFCQKTQLESLQQGLDVLIATPGRFVYLCKEGFLELSSLRSVVLDEVDILFGDDGFEDVLKSLINSAPVSTQYLFVTATLPVDIYNKLVEVFPDCEVIMGPGMHRTSSGLEEVLVDCSGEGEEKTPDSAFDNKKSALLRIVESSSVPKTIVFCNKIETCRKVENILKRVDRKELRVRVLPFHAAIVQQLRNLNMKEFLNSKSNESLFLICTDRASRGIDFANVDHVILFDFPREPSEYVRRVGRTARGAGAKGKAYVFAVGKQVSLARRIIQRNQKGHPLHSVPSAYELESSIL